MYSFSKYQGTGNDFIMIDGRGIGLTFSEEQIAHLCHRRFGIGADGFIILKDHASYDFEMIYYNADGKTSSMCGNGGRCAVKFAHDLAMFEKQAHFLAIDGPHAATVTADSVSLSMIDVKEVLEVPDGLFLNTGSPHLIIFVNELSQLDVKAKGAKIRYSDYWVQKGGVNVNFVQIISPDEIFVRTYERGVEDETYSCGTGVTAAAIAAHHAGMITSTQVKIKSLGGLLGVAFEHDYKNILLKGPAILSFSGHFTL